jgi:hypothetical protein
MPTATRLRHAAERLRELGAAATAATWSADPTGTVCADADLRHDDKGGEFLPEDGPMEVAECYRNERPGERSGNAYLIAALRNAAEPLAAWLDDAAREAEEIGPNYHALAVANALLNEGNTP